jgi:hypothetical protein
VVRIPRFLTTAGSMAEFPIGFSLGAGQYEGGWHAIGASGAGQCMELRYHPGLQISLAAGINVRQPQLLQHLLRYACTIASGEPPTQPKHATSLGFNPSDLEGRYESGGPGSCDVWMEGDKLSCLLHGGSENAKILVEVTLGADRASLASALPGTALCFFQLPSRQSEAGFMFGLSAYKKGGRRG